MIYVWLKWCDRWMRVNTPMIIEFNNFQKNDAELLTLE